MAALLVGVFVAVVSILWQKQISNDQATLATRLENLRFVRQLSSEKDVLARPFAEFDLQGQNLTNLDLKGANLTLANLQHANLGGSDLGPMTAPGPVLTITQQASLYGANLTDANLGGTKLFHADLNKANLTDAYLGGANLEGATLFGANLTGIKYSLETQWPLGFNPPPSA